jgi:ABC-type molybdenum transport system ATPase subunit/photorepair protein PhrA
VNEGEHAAVVGPNGSGKSTLLQLLSKELYPLEREGTSIRLFGKDWWNVWDLRRHLGIVSHDLQHQYLGHPQVSMSSCPAITPASASTIIRRSVRNSMSVPIE